MVVVDDEASPSVSARAMRRTRRSSHMNEETSEQREEGEEGEGGSSKEKETSSAVKKRKHHHHRVHHHKNTDNHHDDPNYSPHLHVPGARRTKKLLAAASDGEGEGEQEEDADQRQTQAQRRRVSNRTTAVAPASARDAGGAAPASKTTSTMATVVTEKIGACAAVCREMCVRTAAGVIATPGIVGGALKAAGVGMRTQMGVGCGAVVSGMHRARSAMKLPPLSRSMLLLVAACFVAVLALVIVGVSVSVGLPMELVGSIGTSIGTIVAAWKAPVVTGMNTVVTSIKSIGSGIRSSPTIDSASLLHGLSSAAESSDVLSSLALTLGEKAGAVDSLAESVKTLVSRLEEQERESKRLGALNAELKAQVSDATASLKKLELHQTPEKQAPSATTTDDANAPSSSPETKSPTSGELVTRAEVDAVVAKKFSEAAVARADLEERLMGIVDTWRERPVVTQTHVEEAVTKFLDVFFADRTGLVDYAYAGTGGLVVRHSPLASGAPLPKSLLQQARLALGLAKVHPRANEWVLSPKSGVPGACLPIAGRNGYVDIRLRTAIAIDAISIEHVPRSVAYDISTAPRRISIYGWRKRDIGAPSLGGYSEYDDNGEEDDSVMAFFDSVVKSVSTGMGGLIGLGGGVDADDPEDETEMLLLGANLEYDIAARPVQTFALPGTSPQTAEVTHVRFRIHDNWGSESHTCIYRLRVHGKPATRTRGGSL